MKKKLLKILLKLSLVEHDKLLHFFHGALIAALLSAFFGSGLMMVGMIVLAISKEMMDERLFQKPFSFKDIGYTILPAILMLFV